MGIGNIPLAFTEAGRQRLLDLLVLAVSMAAVALVLPWQYLLLPTMPTGGDTPSHFAALKFFSEQILPQWRLWGWHPGNLAGFPAFQFYFPLPFAAMSALGSFTGLAISFKLLNVLPALTLPLSVYACLRLLGLPRPGPSLGAAFTVAFLLSEQNTVWGGNLASIAAGEFCYAWALNLSILYLGTLPAWLEGRRSLFWPVCLLTLTGFSHAYGLLFCLVAGLYFPLLRRPFSLMGSRLFLVYAITFLLMGLWTIPMLAYSPYTEMFNFVWINDSVWDFFPPTLLPVLALGALGLGLGLAREKPQSAARTGFLGFWILTACGLYLAAPLMNTVTIRFGPFAHLAAAPLAASAVQQLIKRIPGRWVLTLVLAASTVIWAGWRMEFVDSWLVWNYSGWEVKEPWPEIRSLGYHLRRENNRGRRNDRGVGSDEKNGWFDPGAPRVAYEHSPLHDKAGSIRAFESMPLIAGRSTLEGLYLQASPNAPFIFYIQSEISRRGSSPLPGYVYSRFNLDRALEHMKLYNVSHYIVVDDKTRQAADARGDLLLEREYEPYSLYRLTGNSGRYVQAPKFQPLLVITSRPQFIAYQWFRFTDLKTPLVFLAQADEARGDSFARVYVDSGARDDPLLELIRTDALPRLPLAPSPPPVSETVGNESIEAAGLTPGRPLLIKMSYHPAWRAAGGEKIFRVTPAFMLVFPQGNRLRLSFGPTWIHWAGVGLSALGLVLFALALGWPGLWNRGWLAPSATAAQARQWAGPVFIGTLAVICLAGFAGLWHNHDDAATIRLQAHKLIAQGRQQQAAALLAQGLERWPGSLAADYTMYDLAMTYHSRGIFSESVRLLEQFKKRFPDSIVLPEALYHLGQGLISLGRTGQAEVIKKQLLDQFPHNRWAKEASQWP